MHELVPHKSALLRETAAAASVRAVLALSGVKPQVAREVPVRPERLAALLTQLLQLHTASFLCECAGAA